MPALRPGRGLPPRALALTLAVAACQTADTRPETDTDALRLGRVHVVLEPSEDVVAPDVRDGDDADDAIETQLEVSARFAFVRGLDEEFVRARIDVPVLPHEALRPGECVPSASLVLEAAEPDDNEARELVLLDAGDLSVRVGESDFDVPLALVPDLLPYMSGVEYLQFTNGLWQLQGAVLTAADTAAGLVGLVIDLPPDLG